jgi:hypothetical protein
MLKQMIGHLLLAGAAVLGIAATASAQQTVNFTIGYATVPGQDSRTGVNCGSCSDLDILAAEKNFLSFDVSDFNSVTFGGEWLIPIGQFVEAGAGLSYAQRTVTSVYTNYLNANGAEIEQDHLLRRVPIDLTVRLLPLRQTSPIQPYFGGGLTLINWRYRETGEFIDFSGGGRNIYCVGEGAACDPTYESNGTETGPVILGGVRFAGSGFSVGGEVRWRQATGTLDSDFTDIANKIDLGGWSYQATIGVRFGS